MSLSAPVPVVEIVGPPAKIPKVEVTVFEPEAMLQFRIVLFTAPAPVPRLITCTTAEFIAVEVLLKVRKRPEPPKRPSIVTLSVPFKRIKPPAKVPETVLTVAASGWIVSVKLLIAGSSTHTLSAFIPVSVKSDTTLTTTLPVTTFSFTKAKNPPAPVKVV